MGKRKGKAVKPTSSGPANSTPRQQTLENWGIQRLDPQTPTTVSPDAVLSDYSIEGVSLSPPSFTAPPRPGTLLAVGVQPEGRTEVPSSQAARGGPTPMPTPEMFSARKDDVGNPVFTGALREVSGEFRGVVKPAVITLENLWDAIQSMNKNLIQVTDILKEDLSSVKVTQALTASQAQKNEERIDTIDGELKSLQNLTSLIIKDKEIMVTKLQVSKSKRSVTVVENGAIPLSCQVKAQTNQDSHFAVLWYVHRSSDVDGKLILKTAPNAAFEFGTYAEEEGLRGRLQFERLPAGLFNLTVQKVGVGDSGSYYCHVEEWLLSPNSAWYKLSEEVSGLTEVTVKEPDANLQVSQLQKNVTISESKWVAIDCSITNWTSTNSQISVEWYVWKLGHPEKQRILHLTRDGVLQYGDEEEGNTGERKLPRHLQLEIPSRGLYRLLIQSAEVQDSGAYDCRVQEWLLNSQDKWYKHAEDVSGLTRVTVLQPEAALRLDLTVLNVTVPEKGHFQLDCSLLSRSSPVSRLSLTWFMLRTKSGVAGDGSSEVEKEPVFSIGHDSVFEPEPVRWDGRLRFKRVSTVLFRLSVQEASAADAGNYSCRVEEWLPNPRGLWYKLTEEESGLTVVNVQHTGSTLQSVICSNDALFYFVFFYPFPIFGILIICILLVRFKTRQSNKNSEGKNGVPLLWIKEPHLNYSPTCLEPPVLSIHPATID
ncbi:immunoglobulin superfamily member 3-like [Microcaecilia unicolor]|uniref:immunoglobulin superfamily member 3-like n=1 Tax=Microcaecilia unicolor TaxID=1415580 RepID=UPI001186FAB1|nr:immunoglobulin superfamily member 3-like [Microcaecilia unicolor]